MELLRRFARATGAYLLAIPAVGVMYVLRWALDPLIGADTPFVVLLFLPVVITAWAAGVGPALFAAALAIAVGDYVSIDPDSGAPLAARVVRVTTFMLETLLIAVLIKARRRGERALAASQQRYRTLIDNFPNGAVLLFDRDMHYLIAGGSGLSDMGVTASALVGKRPDEVFPAELSAQLVTRYRATLEGHVQVEELAFRGREYLTYNLPVRDASGAITGGMAMSQDITERKRLEDELRQAQRMDAIGRLAGGVAHDFNNLLTVILGRLDVAAAKLRQDSPAQADLAAISDAATRAAELTRQLLTFSRRQMLDAQVLDLNQVLQAMRPMIERLLGDRIELQLSLEENAPHVRVNRGQLEQVVLNLCCNARDAIEGEGEVVVRTGELEFSEAEALAASVPSGRYACLSVIDTGSGMDETTRQHLFEPFFTTKERGKGTGLGLSIVHGIVGQNGGFISVLSEPGRGSEFRVCLPAIASGTAEPVPLASLRPAPRAAQGHTLLVVEDEDGVRELVRDFLADAGYRVLCAADAEQALAIARAGTPLDVVITDMVLPRMSGYELCQQLREERPEVRTVLVSGYSEELVGLERLIASGTVFLAKPFALSELRERVDKLVPEPERVTASR